MKLALALRSSRERYSFATSILVNAELERVHRPSMRMAVDVKGYCGWVPVFALAYCGVALRG